MVILQEVQTMTHPSGDENIGVITVRNNLIDDNDEIQSETFISEDSSYAFVRSKVNTDLVLKSSVELKSNDKLHDVLVENSIDPRFNLNVESMRMVKYTSELFESLDLNIISNHILGEKITLFSENLSYNERAKRKFKHLVIHRKGYLENISNYFFVDRKYVSDDSYVVTLRNTRVLLYWRGFDLEEHNVKRILTLGFCFLTGNLSTAELYYYISILFPKGSFEVNIKYKSNTFVLITIEKPLFS